MKFALSIILMLLALSMSIVLGFERLKADSTFWAWWWFFFAGVWGLNIVLGITNKYLERDNERLEAEIELREEIIKLKRELANEKEWVASYRSAYINQLTKARKK